MRSGTIAVVLSALIALLVACDSKPGSATDRHEPVVVYAAHSAEDYLPEFVSGFTDETGIPVTFRYGEPAKIVDDVIENRGSPPADVLLTSNVADVWRAADEGALRPLQAAAMNSLPDVLKDPDKMWAAFDVRYAAIGVSPHVKTNKAGDYESLAHENVRGELCLSSSALPVNRALIAMLIEDLGQKGAEILVRGWVQNLAVPPFGTEEKLAAALESGTCSYGILSSSIRTERAKLIGPVPLYIDIDGIGVVRHARYPDAAHSLVDWMLEEKSLQQPASSNGRNIGMAGWRDQDAVLLSQRAGYR